MQQGLQLFLIRNSAQANEETRIFGRFAPAWACDRWGRFNIAIASTATVALLAFSMWIPTGNSAARSGFAALYGVVSGATLSIIPTLAAQVCPDVKKLGAYTGITFLVMSPGFLFALPIGGALSDGSGSVSMKLFCGCAMCVGSIFLGISRSFHLRAKAEVLKPGEELPSFRVALA